MASAIAADSDDRSRSTPVRLVLVGPLPPPPGGMANQTQQLARLLGGEGIDVRLVRTNPALVPQWLGSVRGVRGILRAAAFLRSLNRSLRGADVVHVMANSGWIWFLTAAPAIRAASRRGIPVIVNYRGGLAEQFLAKSARRVLPTLTRASALVVPSRFLQDVFARYGVESLIVPNVVDLDVFRPAEAKAQSTGRAHVVVMRSLEALYGIDVAIRATAILRGQFPELRLSIAGSGPERAELERLVADLRLGDVVRFTGRLTVAEAAALYAEADVALNPSRADNMPNSLLEAAACGIPIVSTNVGGVPYLVEHRRTAWLVEPDSPEQMAQGIAAVLRDDALRAAMRENGLRLARACAWSAVGRGWLDLYARLVRAFPGADAPGATVRR